MNGVLAAISNLQNADFKAYKLKNENYQRERNICKSFLPEKLQKNTSEFIRVSWYRELECYGCNAKIFEKTFKYSFRGCRDVYWYTTNFYRNCECFLFLYKNGIPNENRNVYVFKKFIEE